MLKVSFMDGTTADYAEAAFVMYHPGGAWELYTADPRQPGARLMVILSPLMVKCIEVPAGAGAAISLAPGTRLN